MIDIKEVKELNIFEGASDASIKALSEIGTLNCYLKNSHIFRERETVDNIYVVFNGKVAIYKINEDGHKKVVFILNRGTFINEAQLDNLTSSVNCEAFENCEILSFNKEKFMEIMAGDFKVTTIVINALAKKTRRMYRQLKNSTSINIKKKVAAKLWKFSNDYGVEVEEGTLIDLAMSVTYLSEMFGIPRETISRVLKILAEKNLIIQKNKKIIVVDKDVLAMYFKGLTKDD